MLDLDRKLSRAQDLAIDGLISPDELREKVVAIRTEKERLMHELKTLKSVRESINRLEGQETVVYALYVAALIGKHRYLSSEDYHRVYKKLGLKVRVAPDGSLEVEGSVDSNFLPTDMGNASSVYWQLAEEAEEKVFDEMSPNEKRRQAEFDYAVWAATSIRTVTSTTRHSK